MKQKPKIEIIDSEEYQPTKEEIKKICDEAYEENKEWLTEIIKRLPND